MTKAYTNILEAVAKVGLNVAVNSVGRSLGGAHQPKEPKALRNFKK